MELIFQVKNQRLYLMTVNQVVADSKNYLSAAFSFTDDWDGAVKVAQFTRDNHTINVTINAGTGKCMVPQAVLSGEGEFYVSVHGKINNEATIITANAVKIAVLPSGFVTNAGTISADTAAAMQAHADAVTAVINNSTSSAGGYVHQIVFTIRNQSMYLTTRGKIVADSQGYLGAKFLFTDDWNGTIKIAQFKRDSLFYNILLDANNECTVPWEVLVDEGIFIANVFGNNPQNSANRIITVNPVEVHVEKSGLTAGELPSNPTIGIDGQVLYEIYRYAEEAAASAQTAQNASITSQRYATSAGESASSAAIHSSSAESSAIDAENSASSAAANAATILNVLGDINNLSEEVSDLSVTVNDAVNDIATNVNLSQKWAVYMGGLVDGLDYSSKYYALQTREQATNAAASASSALNSKTDAENAAYDAADSAASATISANTATTNALSASASASAAASSETAARASASNAASSERNAATSETNAATSEQNAFTSESNAAASASSAASKASEASGYASTASTKAGEAAGSASNAAASASNAAGSATSAENSATDAAASKTAAQQAKNDAETAADTVRSIANGPHYEFDTNGYLYVVYGN